MSFILDALKKSETERQRQGGTEFAAIPLSSGKSAVPRWLWVVGLLLIINLAVLISLLFRPDPPAVQATQPRIGQSVALPATDDDPGPSFEQKVVAARQRQPEQQQGSIETAATVTGPGVQAVLISQDPASVPASDRYPTLQEVRTSGTMQLPDLHLDIHVYSEVPKDRFVFINMSKLREGSQLAEGPVVAEITPDGVVLGHQGQYFLLSRE